MVKKSCDYCAKSVDLNKHKYVLLGTYSGKKTEGESYFHFKCFKKNWEDRIREKATNIVSQMAKAVTPLAKKVANKIAGVDIDQEIKVDF